MSGAGALNPLAIAGTDGKLMLRQLWRRSRPGLAAVGVFSVFINLLKLAIPIYILHILDRVISSGSLETLVMLTVITLVAVVCAVLLEIVRRRLMMQWGDWIERTVGPKVFTASLKATNDNLPESSRLLRDLGTFRAFVGGPGLLAWIDVVWAPVFVLVVFLIAPPLGYVVIIGSLLVIALGAISEYATRDSRNATLKAGRAGRDWVTLAEREPESIGSLHRVNGLAGLWFRNATERLDEAERTRSKNVYFTAAIRLIGQFVRVAIYAIGIWLVITNVLTIGAVIAAAILGRMAFSMFRDAMMRWREMVNARRAYGAVRKALHKDSSAVLSRTSRDRKSPLVVDDVAFRYPQQSNSVFRRMTVTVEPGQLLCVIGPSAVGKTTLCRLLSGSLTARSGKILLGDTDVFHLQQNSPDQEIAYLPQEITLFPATVRENIAGHPDNSMTMVVVAAKLAGIHDVILRLPQGYDTEIDDKEPLLSAGQRKCIALARALYGLPHLLVLDEPLAHLDTELRRRLVRGLRKLQARGVIVVMTTQRKNLASLADKVIVFENGRHFLLESAKEVEALQAGEARPTRRNKSRKATSRRSDAERRDKLRSV